MYSIENRDDLEKLNVLNSLQNQVKALRLRNELVKRNFPEDMKKVFEPVTNSIKNVSEDGTRTMMESSKENNKAPENFNDRVLEINVGVIFVTLLFIELTLRNTYEVRNKWKTKNNSK